MSRGSQRRPAVFVDRDGVIIRNRDDYVKGLDEVEILPGAIEALAALSHAGHPVVVITNQSAIGRGIVARATVDEIHEALAKAVEQAGGRIDAFVVCPHRPDEACDCRKPKPGMLRHASETLGLDLSVAYMVGDQPADIQAARAAGCTPVFVASAYCSAEEARQEGAAHCAADLRAAAAMILAAPSPTHP